MKQRNQVSAQRANRVEKWIDYTFRNDRDKAINRKWKAVSVKAVRPL